MIDTIRLAVCKVLTNKSGAAMAEYGLLVALIAVAAVAATTGVGGAITAKFTAISTAL